MTATKLQPTCIKLELSQLAEGRAQARQEGRSFSSWIRRLVARELAASRADAFR